jgi:hypothetical protein
MLGRLGWAGDRPVRRLWYSAPKGEPLAHALLLADQEPESLESISRSVEPLPVPEGYVGRVNDLIPLRNLLVFL